MARKTSAAPVAALRRRMDRVNRELVRVLQRRARLALEIGRAKQRLGMSAADPARERAMLREALAQAPDGFSHAELARVLRAVFAASRRAVVRQRRS